MPCDGPASHVSPTRDERLFRAALDFFERPKIFGSDASSPSSAIDAKKLSMSASVADERRLGGWTAPPSSEAGGRNPSFPKDFLRFALRLNGRVPAPSGTSTITALRPPTPLRTSPSVAPTVAGCLLSAEGKYFCCNANISSCLPGGNVFNQDAITDMRSRSACWGIRQRSASSSDTSTCLWSCCWAVCSRSINSSALVSRKCNLFGFKNPVGAWESPAVETSAPKSEGSVATAGLWRR